MTPPPARRRQSSNRRRKGNRNEAVDLWRPVPRLAAPAPILPAEDPGMLLRSLGQPPLQGQGAVAEHYLVAVVERAAAVATALAASVDLLGTPPED